MLAPFVGGCRLNERTATPAGHHVIVNDVHSQLNPTRVKRIVRSESVEALREAIRDAGARKVPVSIAGGRHAMGGQQFGTEMVLLDTAPMNRVVGLDVDRGLVEVEAGIQWPELIDYLVQTQEGHRRPWGIVQKQTGADSLSIGGALAANAHGRGLTYRPIVQDVESFVLIDGKGKAIHCSREENSELFRLAIGGYGCFGAFATIRLRLRPRTRIERVVEVIDVDHLMRAFDRRIADGYLYGDFQFAIDETSDEFLRRGLLSCYRPVDQGTPGRQLSAPRSLSNDDWLKLACLSHVDKGKAFERYTEYYLSTSGQVYWSDTHQLSTYVDDYHGKIVSCLGDSAKATELITEIYVPRDRLDLYMTQAREWLRSVGANVIYGTIRLIEKDDECFLTPASEAWACIVFNLHVEHTAEGKNKAKREFLGLIDLAIEQGGSYFLTYHRFASRRQVEACYPQFAEFLRLKRKFDPDERFQNDWYTHYRKMFEDIV